MTTLEKAIAYFEDAVRESDEILAAECSKQLQKELTEQKCHFEVALGMMEKQVPKKAEPINYNPEEDYYGLGCPNCAEIVGQLDNEDADGIYKYNIFANYCPDCGQKIEQNYTEEDFASYQQVK